MRFLIFVLGTTTAAIVVKRASNSYGDEMVVPHGGGGQLSENTAPEKDASRVRQSYSTYSSAVQSSGYRKKRASNSYGDEQVIPHGGGAQDPYKPMPEIGSAQVSQYASKNNAAVVSSGYR